MSNSLGWDKIRILVTNRCNYNCSFCHNEGQNNRTRSMFMSILKFKELIDMIKDEDVSELTFSGGEPFLNKDIVAMIKYAALNTKWELSCATNLSLVSKEQIEELKGIPLKFNIQFPYTDKLHYRKSTVNGDFDLLREKMSMVRSHGLRIGLNCVIQTSSQEDIEKMLAFAATEGLPLKLLPEIGLNGSYRFKEFVFPMLDKYAIAKYDKHTGAKKWLIEYDGHTTSVMYIDSPCFTRNIDECRRYSELRILPDMTIQTCILRQQGNVKLDFSLGKDKVIQQIKESWKNLKKC